MGKLTAILLKPTLEECVHLAKDPEIQLPEREAKKFWAHYEARGWEVTMGKVTKPMKSLRGAMVGWKLRWEERGGTVDHNGHSHSGLSGVDKQILHEELKRLLDKMKLIRDGYSGLMEWRATDKALYKQYKNRVDEIRGKLGVVG